MLSDGSIEGERGRQPRKRGNYLLLPITEDTNPETEKEGSTTPASFFPPSEKQKRKEVSFFSPSSPTLHVHCHSLYSFESDLALLWIIVLRLLYSSCFQSVLVGSISFLFFSLSLVLFIVVLLESGFGVAGGA